MASDPVSAQVQLVFERITSRPSAEWDALLAAELRGGTPGEVVARVAAMLAEREPRSVTASFLAGLGTVRGAGAPADARTTAGVGQGAGGSEGARVGERVGPYTILQVLGEGGFGTVYLGERTEPMRQLAAIKVIKRGRASSDVVARFELERQSLAMMAHPNVARVLDAGSTERGEPYFVMEYVPGESITAFCDKHQLGIRERLGIMGQVCDAVQHAHLKGLIHRDLKPGNILVQMVDGAPIAKVIDFGIAKAIKQEELGAETFTLEGMLIGTPEYMSPEQAGGEPDIDTRTDIYSLGVILYELLTGALPFDPRTLRARGLSEIQRIIREVDPPRPSTRIGELGESMEAVAKGRKTQAGTLERVLRRELEWIPMKAMRKDRSRRYKTAQELHDDLARYLKGEALLAGPESRVYRARKFVARNRIGVASAAVVLGAIVAASVVSVRFGIAERRARLDEQKAKEEATTQRDVAESVNGFVNEDLFGAIDPDVQDPDVKVVDVLDRAVAAVDVRLKDKPAVRARVLQTLGDTYRRIGRPKQARPLLEEVKKLDDSLGLLTPDERDRLIMYLSESLWRQLENEEASKLLGPAVVARRSRLGVAAKNDVLLAEMLNGLGGLHKWSKKYDDATGAYEESLDIRTRVLGAGNQDTLITSHNLVGVDELRWKAALFEAFAAKDEEAKTRVRAELSKVRERMREVAQRCTDALGAEAPVTLGARAEVAYLSNMCGDFDAGIRDYLEVLPLLRKKLTEGHWRTLDAAANLADAYRKTGRHAEAVEVLLGTVEAFWKVRGVSFPDTAMVSKWLADSLEKINRAAESGRVLQRVYDGLKSAGVGEERVRAAAKSLAEFYERQNQPEAAQRWRDAAQQP